VNSSGSERSFCWVGLLFTTSWSILESWLSTSPFRSPVGENGNGSRRFTIAKISLESSQFGPFGCIRLLRGISGFTGTGLRQLSLHSKSFIDVESQHLIGEELQRQLQGCIEVFNEIWLHRDILEDLVLFIQVNSITSESLELVTNCPSLKSLELNFTSQVKAGQEDVKRIFSFPSDVVTSELRNLRLGFVNSFLDWEAPSLLTWIGTKLENLSLDLDQVQSEQPVSGISLSKLHRLFQSNPGLQSLGWRAGIERTT